MLQTLDVVVFGPNECKRKEEAEPRSRLPSSALGTYLYQWLVPRRAFGDHDVAYFGVSFVIGQGVPRRSKYLCIKGLGHFIPRGV